MKKLSPVEQEAKLKVLQDCMDGMDEMMGEGLDKKKAMKVSVAASSPKGLKAGLEKAKDVLEGDHDMLSSGEDDLEEGLEEDELSEEEIDAQIQELLAKKERLKV